jgi:hypothetical protein
MKQEKYIKIKEFCTKEVNNRESWDKLICNIGHDVTYGVYRHGKFEQYRKSMVALVS